MLNDPDVSKRSFTKAFFEAEKIVPLGASFPDYGYRVGYTFAHRVPKPFVVRDHPVLDPDEYIKKYVFETVHHTTVYLFPALIPALWALYTRENELGGNAEPQWAFRPSIWWTYCEECKTLFWARKEDKFFPLCPGVFPINYTFDIDRFRFILTQTEKHGLVVWNNEWFTRK